ncbi:MAG: XRE family transcriptional regulator [Ruminococcus sp.]|uniref:XRE family transcriptional regulator n=1 Tax=Ruminococcus sp. TaxID=41978 RepID=UPI001B28121F|nr:XRE family transcriptional regulator [Ruminococcus sp.]MBO7474597.1 XRE family transcriptional regulator [Ruminococcus sp.]
MTYELRHFDTPLMRFTATEDTSSPEIDILWVNEEKKALLPLDMTIDGDSVSRWLRHRTIPKNRAYVHSFLSKCGLNLNRPMSILSVSKGLSLNDCYWVVEEGFEGSFSQYNLYANRFSRVLGLIAFTGYGSSVRTSLASCPEFTTNGMLPKCWRRENGIIRLYKGGTSGASNMGNEPYSEFYAAQIADALGINAISYGLSKWQGELCSTCELFTSKDYSFMPIGRLVSKGGMKAVRDYYKSLGEEFINALDDMMVLDAIICNVDRHFGNFGFLMDNHTNKIAAPAPLFDHGNSLFNLAGRDDLVSDKALSDYADTLVPCVYDDFIGTAKQVLSNRHREGLRRLLDFRFKRHSRYNLDSKRLKLIEEQIHKRAKELLK